MVESSKTPVLVGAGWSVQSRASGVSALTLAMDAAYDAVRDAGLAMHDIDAVICFGRRDGPGPLLMASALGLPSLRYFLEFDGGGYASNTVVMVAAQAIEAGMAKNVLVYRAMNGRTGPHRFGGEQAQPIDIAGAGGQFIDPVGARAPVLSFALAAQAHMNQYGTTSEQLGAVAVTMREHALHNERAVMRKPITVTEHQESRMIASPFHLLDCAIETDGACAVVLSTADVAAGLGKPLVRIRASAVGAGSFPVGGSMWADESRLYSYCLADELYERAGVRPADVDIAEIYDCFTFSLLAQVEDYGFCERGEGGPFAESGGLRADGGRIPTNTHGGLLSEAYLQGLGHVCEAVSQLHGTAGDRQVDGAQLALVTGQGGHMGGALILERLS
jgi:acetyl-CoA acetyltransferase